MQDISEIKKHLPIRVNVARKKLGRHLVTNCTLCTMHLYCIIFFNSFKMNRLIIH